MILPVDTFRERMVRAYRKYRAILILTNGVCADDRIYLDSTAARIGTMPAARLRSRAKDLFAAVRRAEQLYGVIGSLEQLEAITSQPPQGEGTVMYLAKAAVSQLFTRYDRALPNFDRMPPHARIGIDIAAVQIDVGKVSIFHLEASLFEDMAALWNAAASASQRDETTAPTEVKTAVALRRATIKAAFNLLEAYVNGIALDILLLRNVPPEIEATLDEWDAARNRPVRLSLRDKLLQYPKIAMQVEHPPVQESNSPAMATVLAAEALLRHALIHPTARVSPGENHSREQTLMDMPLSEVGLICDAIVALIRQIGGMLPPEFGDVNMWVFDRTNNRYPDEVFL